MKFSYKTTFVLQQMTTTQVKVDKVQVSGTCNTTFAVCLDQDEKKILQSVARYSLFLLAFLCWCLAKT